MTPEQFRAIQSRRQFMQQGGYGLGTIALAHLMGQEGRTAAVDDLGPKRPHFPGKAKSVIFLFMGGGPSQMDLFHPKPKLNEYHGRPLPESLQKDLAAALAQRTESCTCGAPATIPMSWVIRHDNLAAQQAAREVFERWNLYTDVRFSTGPEAAADASNGLRIDSR